MSILVGALLMFVNLAGLVGWGGAYAAARRAEASRLDEPAPAAAPVAPAAQAIEPYDADPIGAQGLRRAERVALAREVHSATPLSADRRVMLDRLLADFGAAVVPDGAGGLTETRAREAIVEAGQLPAGPDGLRSLGTQYFRTSAGTVLIDDAKAKFRAADGWMVADGDEVVDARGRRRRSAAAVAQELESLRARFGGQINALQARSLAEWMAEQPSDVRQNRYDPARKPIKMVSRTVQVGETMGTADPMIWVLPDGRVIRNPFGLQPDTGLPQVQPGSSSVARQLAGAAAAGRTLAGWMVADTAAGCVLGMWVLMAGVLTCADARPAGRLHAAWAWLKLLASAGTAVVAGQILGALPVNAGVPGWVIGIGVAVWGLLMFSYPVCVLSVLHTKRVGRHYAAMGADVSPLPPGIRTWVGNVTAAATDTSRGRRILKAAGVVAALTVAVHATALVWRPVDRADGWWDGTVARGLLVAAGIATAAVCARGARGRREGRGPGRATSMGAAVASATLFACILVQIGEVRGATSRPTAVRAGAATTTLASAYSTEEVTRVRGMMSAVMRDADAPEAGALRREVAEGKLAVYELLCDGDPAVVSATLKFTASIKPPKSVMRSLTRSVPQVTSLARDAGAPAEARQLAVERLAQSPKGRVALAQIVVDGDDVAARWAVVALGPQSPWVTEAETKALQPAAGRVTGMLRDLGGDEAHAAAVLARLGPRRDVLAAIRGRLAESPADAEYVVPVLERFREDSAAVQDLLVAAAGAGPEGRPAFDAFLKRYATRGESVPYALMGKLTSGDELVRRGAERLLSHGGLPVRMLATLVDRAPETATSPAVAGLVLCRQGPDEFEKWAEAALVGSAAERDEAMGKLRTASRAIVPSDAVAGGQGVPRWAEEGAGGLRTQRMAVVSGEFQRAAMRSGAVDPGRWAKDLYSQDFSGRIGPVTARLATETPDSPAPLPQKEWVDATKFEAEAVAQLEREPEAWPMPAAAGRGWFSGNVGPVAAAAMGPGAAYLTAGLGVVVLGGAGMRLAARGTGPRRESVGEG